MLIDAGSGNRMLRAGIENLAAEKRVLNVSRRTLTKRSCCDRLGELTGRWRGTMKEDYHCYLEKLLQCLEKTGPAQPTYAVVMGGSVLNLDVVDKPKRSTLASTALENEKADVIEWLQ